MNGAPAGALGIPGRVRPGEWLRKQRVGAGLTQEDLAERSGVSVRAIADLERGRTRRPYPSSVRALAAALGLPETAGAELVARYRAGGDCDGGAGRAPAPAAAARREATVPRQLPSGVAHFAGRGAELAALDAVLGGGAAGEARRRHLRHRGDGRGRQDRARAAVGAPGRGPVPGRAALRQPARVRRRGRAAERSGRRAAGLPRRVRGAPGADSARHRVAGRALPVGAGGAADAGAARQRGRRRPGAAAAARVAGVPGDRHQPARAVGAGRPRGRAAGPAGRAVRPGGERAAGRAARGRAGGGRAVGGDRAGDAVRAAAAGAVGHRRPGRGRAPAAAGGAGGRADRARRAARRARRGRPGRQRADRAVAVLPAPAGPGGADVPAARAPSGSRHQRGRGRVAGRACRPPTRGWRCATWCGRRC